MLEEQGFQLRREIFPLDLVARWSDDLDAALHVAQKGTLSSRDKIYGSRNILDTWPQVARIPRRPEMRQIVSDTLGQEAGLVRTLFFDKPPGRGWSLPWHRDKTIAVQEHLPGQTEEYRCPTTKAGIPHVEAPEWLLRRMLTLRLHLDPMTSENGPLVVLPGSHRTHDDTRVDQEPHVVLCDAGDVLAMRPLLSHSSRASEKSTNLRRRILHFEFCNVRNLTCGFRWHSFTPLA